MPAEPRRQAGAPGAERTGNRLREVGVPSEKIRLVTPGASRAEFEAAIPVEDMEGRGVGTVLGGILGGAIALLVSPFFVPGGPYAAIGLRGVTLIVALGAVILGTVLGATIEKTVTKGVPHDVVFLYEEALHRRTRGRPYDEVAQELQKHQGDGPRTDDFRRGYERGHAYYASRSWMVTTPAPAPTPTGVPPHSWWR